MSNYAKVLNGKVIEVIVADENFFKTFVDTSPGTWIETSYDTYGNENAKSGTPLRGNFASIGFTYDSQNDVFYAPQPFPSWSLDANWLWQAPIEMPTDGKHYLWNESSKTWVEQNV
jgi:hypothetical protein